MIACELQGSLANRLVLASFQVRASDRSLEQRISRKQKRSKLVAARSLRVSRSGDDASLARSHRDKIIVIHKIHRNLDFKRLHRMDIQSERFALLDNAFK